MIIGNLTKDPESRVTQSGVNLTREEGFNRYGDRTRVIRYFVKERDAA